MTKSTDILHHFPAYIFWDAKADTLDIKANSQYIIEKVMISCADQEDFNNAIQILEKLYSKKKLENTIFNSKELISKMKFYTKKRYVQKLEYV